MSPEAATCAILAGIVFTVLLTVTLIIAGESLCYGPD